LRRIVLIDEVSGRKPRTHGMGTLDGNIVTKMSAGFGMNSLILTAMVPFTFVEPTMEEATMCKDSPFVTTQAAAEFLNVKPTAGKYLKGGGKSWLEWYQSKRQGKED
jgi:hypothetical protein